MRLLDSRRLTGANLFMDCPGAVIDVAVDAEDVELVAACWKAQARGLLRALGWPGDALIARPFEGGVSLAVGAPEDGLYTATELNEAAWEAARDQVEGGQRHLLHRISGHLRSDYRDEERPRLQRLLAAAKERHTTVLLDDDQLTLGTGRHAQSWDLYELPHPDDVSWRRLRAVPTVLVTGTNGKTTTVRLLASIAKEAGRVAGVSSTDWLAMGDELLARDDYAGPGGARLVLRDSRCELAILETARGGLLRRGLALPYANVAVITNIAADHLGDYGVKTVDDLADVKWTVARALDDKGSLVINAEDPLLMARTGASAARLTLFAVDPKCPCFVKHVRGGGKGFSLQRGSITRYYRGKTQAIAKIAEIPLSYGGSAVHNIANALAAAAAADGLGLSRQEIEKGLCALSVRANPGRANLYSINGATVLLDFAHNPAGLEALMPLTAAIPATRRLLVIGQAGDREDADLQAFANAASALQFDRILIKRMDGHARGREIGEVARIMRRAFVDQGYSSKQLGQAKSELDAVRAALRWAQTGDLVVLLSHENREATRRYIETLADKEVNSC